jgi:hypothetical protein
MQHGEETPIGQASTPSTGPLGARVSQADIEGLYRDVASTSHSSNATNDASVPSTARCLATQCPAKLVTSSLASFDGPTALPAVPRGYLGHTSLVAFQLPKSLVSAVGSAWRSRARHVGEHWPSFRLSRSSWASDETP